MPGGATAPAVARSTTTLPTKTGLSSGTLHGRNPWIRRATWAIVLVGAALRLWQYAAGTSLWWDELAVAQNIIGRPMFLYWSFQQPRDEYTRTSIAERLQFLFTIVIHFFDQTRWSRMFHVVR